MQESLVMTTGKDAGPFELLLTMDIRDELCSVDNQKKKTDGEIKITKKKKKIMEWSRL